jgi:hypothetical protein
MNYLCLVMGVFVGAVTGVCVCGVGMHVPFTQEQDEILAKPQILAM